MPTPSVFQQGLPAWAVPAWSLVPSPRNYNASIVDYDGRRLMAYRSHRMDQGGRCGLVLAEMNAKWEAEDNHWLDLPEQVHSVTVHHEDPRLFVHRGRLHVAFTETMFRYPAPYVCVMKYARLKERGGKWVVDRVFWPRYGQNDGGKQEKNWQFFTGPREELLVVYQGEPHTILEVEGERVVEVHKAPAGVKWPWGTIRGGTPPVLQSDGQYLTFFHSATPYPVPPHWRRYYAGAYTFEAKAPFRITAISQMPLLTGSEEDGHGFDPRNIDSWKPFVVFPSGIIAGRRGKWGEVVESWLVSYGINDHTIAIVEHSDLKLGDPGFANWGWRYFRTENGSAPVRVWVEDDKPPKFIRWERAKGGAAGQAPGVLATTDPRLALQLHETAGVEPLTAEQYQLSRC